MAIEVTLELSSGSTPGREYYFVTIRGVPHSKCLVITDARPLAVAEKIKTKVEKALREYGAPPVLIPDGPRRSRLERV
jgi:hypothetical protein